MWWTSSCGGGSTGAELSTPRPPRGRVTVHQDGALCLSWLQSPPLPHVGDDVYLPGPGETDEIKRCEMCLVNGKVLGNVRACYLYFYLMLYVGTERCSWLRPQPACHPVPPKEGA